MHIYIYIQEVCIRKIPLLVHKYGNQGTNCAIANKKKGKKKIERKRKTELKNVQENKTKHLIYAA